MSEARDVIPFERLPRGFASALDRPGTPAEARPAATVVVLRRAGDGMEVLLLRRARSAGFVPGAYVFPGGRVDPADEDPGVLALLSGRTPEAWGQRLGTNPAKAAAFLVAALRETFEETGILVARDEAGTFVPSAAAGSAEPDPGELRDRLLGNELNFAEVLEALQLRLDDGATEYIAHWVTPEAEPRRYDTRFFAVRVPAGVPVLPQEDEIIDHVWLSPAAALRRQREGELPMVFPTIRTLEALARFDRPDHVLDHFRGRGIPRILPRLVRTPTGVGIEVPEEA